MSLSFSKKSWGTKKNNWSAYISIEQEMGDSASLHMNSETGSLPSSDLNVPVIPSFSISGRKRWTNSAVYGGAITSNT